MHAEQGVISPLFTIPQLAGNVGATLVFGCMKVTLNLTLCKRYVNVSHWSACGNVKSNSQETL